MSNTQEREELIRKPETQGERAELIERLREYVANKCKGKQVEADMLMAAELLDTSEEDALRAQMADLLTRTANALRGDPEPKHHWSWHDLPERAQAAIAAIDVMQKAAALQADGKAGGEVVSVTDEMAYAFHRALTDSALSADEVEEIKTGLRAALANYTRPQQAAQVAQPLTVWFDQMPESNGKRNWTVMLRRKGSERVLGSIAYGVCFERTEYYDRARYAADRLRFLIGELDKEPDILNYNPDILQPGEAAHGIGKDQAP